MKYLVLAAASAAFLLFGMALVYARARARMEFARMAGRAGRGGRRCCCSPALALIVAGHRLQAGAWCRSTCGRRTSTKARPRR